MNIPVFLASDNNYTPFVASTIASMCDNTESFIDFYILDGGMEDESKDKIKSLQKKFNNFSIEFISIDLDDKFNGFFTSGSISLAAYSRLLIPVLKPNLKKVIYTDVDIIVKDDIAKLYNEDLDGYSIAAAWEECFQDSINMERNDKLNLDLDNKYFNSGILLMDCEKWREDNTTEKLLSIALNKKDMLESHDQDVLNLYFENNYLNLAPKYCYLTEYHEYGTSAEDMVIRHYSRFKPWEISPELDNSLKTDHDIFWHYINIAGFYDECLNRVLYNDLAQLGRFSKLRAIAIRIVGKRYESKRKNLNG